MLLLSTFHHLSAMAMMEEASFFRPFVLLLANEDVLESLRPPRRFHEAQLVRQVILAICEATSGTALTGVANLEAVLEVRKK